MFASRRCAVVSMLLLNFICSPWVAADRNQSRLQMSRRQREQKRHDYRGRGTARTRNGGAAQAAAARQGGDSAEPDVLFDPNPLPPISTIHMSGAAKAAAESGMDFSRLSAESMTVEDANELVAWANARTGPTPPGLLPHQRPSDGEIAAIVTVAHFKVNGPRNRRDRKAAAVAAARVDAFFGGQQRTRQQEERARYNALRTRLRGLGRSVVANPNDQTIEVLAPVETLTNTRDTQLRELLGRIALEYSLTSPAAIKPLGAAGTNAAAFNDGWAHRYNDIAEVAIELSQSYDYGNYDRMHQQVVEPLRQRASDQLAVGQFKAAIEASGSGVVLGEATGSNQARALAVFDLPTLRSLQVTTIYTDSLAFDQVQASLDEYFQAPAGAAMDPALDAAVRQVDGGDGNFHGSLRQLIVEGKQAGIRVVAIDDGLAQSSNAPRIGGQDMAAGTERAARFNFIASDIIDNDRGRRSNEKFVVLVSGEHVNTHPGGVPGMSQLLNVPGLQVDVHGSSEFTIDEHQNRSGAPRLQARAAAGNPEQARQRNSEALALFSSANYDQAAARFQQAFQLDNHPSIAINAGRSLLQAGRQEEARLWLYAALSLAGISDEDRSGAMNALADIRYIDAAETATTNYRLSRQFAAAGTLYLQAYRRHANTPTLALFAARNFAKQGDDVRAASVYREILTFAPAPEVAEAQREAREFLGTYRVTIQPKHQHLRDIKNADLYTRTTVPVGKSREELQQPHNVFGVQIEGPKRFERLIDGSLSMANFRYVLVGPLGADFDFEGLAAEGVIAHMTDRTPPATNDEIQQVLQRLGIAITLPANPSTRPTPLINSIKNRTVAYLKSANERAPYKLEGNPSGQIMAQSVGPDGTRSMTPYDTRDNSTMFSKEGWSIYVMDPDGGIYAGTHRPSAFHHSSFLAGAAVAGAGEFQFTNGRLVAISNKSGHYAPEVIQLVQTLRELRSMGQDLKGVTVLVVGGKDRAESRALAYEAGRWPHDAETFVSMYENDRDGFMRIWELEMGFSDRHNPYGHENVRQP